VEQVRTAEVIAALCLATDLGMGLPLEHGLQSTLIAMRLADRLGVASDVGSQTYYGCLLFYIGCTADAEISADLFAEGALLTHFTPVMFGTRPQTLAGIMRALASPGSGPGTRALQVGARLPRAVRGHQRHIAALCEVGQMLTDRLQLPPDVRGMFAHLTERWDGHGEPAGLKADQIPLALRVIHVARDAAFQRMLGGEEHAAKVVRERAGHAFDPTIATLLADEAQEILTLDGHVSVWDDVVAGEPSPRLTMQGDDIDIALAAMGDFADLASPYLVGHSAGVADLVSRAAQRCHFSVDDLVATRRAAFVHDVGRVAIPANIWQQSAQLTADDWERVRLHAYHSERILCRSTFLSSLASVATAHHERLDGAGYHRGVTSAALTPPARLLAAADAYHAMTEPRPHRAALSADEAAQLLRAEVVAGKLDAGSVAAVLEAAGHRPMRVDRPDGLTERETQVVALLARGLQTKQIGRALGISTKTADRHVQNAYGKIGVSTRAAAALYAMQNGLVAWGELPIVDAKSRA
jgi:HD-GYP domain-containing protein (c-di-GMP phosphodiesterase class II)